MAPNQTHKITPTGVYERDLMDDWCIQFLRVIIIIILAIPIILCSVYMGAVYGPLTSQWPTNICNITQSELIATDEGYKFAIEFCLKSWCKDDIF